MASGSNPRRTADLFDVALFLGALFGAYLLRYGVALPLFVTGACVLLTTAAYAVIAKIGLQRHSSSKSLERVCSAAQLSRRHDLSSGLILYWKKRYEVGQTGTCGAQR